MYAATLIHKQLHAWHLDLHVTDFPRAIAAYLVVADEEYGRQIPFAFLERVRDEFSAKYAEKGKTAGPNSLSKSFG